MRSLLAMCAVGIVALAFGYGVGFAVSAGRSMFDMPLLTNPYASRDNFTGVFRGFDRLAAAEIAGGACDIPTNDYLSAQDYAITAIQERAASAGLNPPHDVARARLALRRARVAERNNDLQLKMKYEEDARQLLQKSGWKDSSPAHLQQIVYAIDSRENTCRPSTPKLDQSK
jgi:hypothetical protein